MENVPLVVVNFSTEDIPLSKGEVLGFMQNQSLDISEIITETSTKPSTIMIEDLLLLQLIWKYIEKLICRMQI